MAYIRLDQIEFNIGTQVLLDKVSLTLDKGERLGLLGRNGAGKSTLMRLIAGVDQPTTGSIERTMTTSWPIGYGGAFQASMTGADNVRFIARIYRQPERDVMD